MQTKDTRNTGMSGFLACTVKQFMTHPVMTVTRRTSMRVLEGLFEKYDFNAFPVVEDGKVFGIVSKFDFLRTFAFTTGHVVPQYNQLMSQYAGDVMAEAVVHVDPTSPLTRVLQLMVNLKIRSFPVMNVDCRLEGIISREDIMRALKEATQESQ